ncbi:hypothetical protein MUN84_02705 [Hymenobacter sp. 5516J-16]|uniref:hypothetical protein n=1 Tax=Hymenobacter sp. 5516J-16 TaxID=2932253 RepID=UPI001FD0BBE7|nr:hypothetical protein [Hymenobacter sp. 5516J-16]UOQ77617.1 hypothetical protein MUN84_02705 [Hymenobacter sp. 5516J-16]
MDELNRRKETVCMAAIRPLGYPDAKVIVLPTIMLVTLRSQPTPPCRAQTQADVQVISQLNAAWQMRQLHTPEFQVAFKSLPAVRMPDTAAVRALRRKAPRLNQVRYEAALQQLQRQVGLTFEQAVAALCYATTDTVREKAVAQAASRLQSAVQAQQLLPFLRDASAGVQVMQLLRGYYRYHPPTTAEWARLMPELVAGLTTPDPIVATGLATWLTEQQVPRTYARQLLTKGAITQLEILHGRHPDLVVFKQQLYPFLSYLSATEIRTEQAALAYLGQFQPRKK